MKIVIEYDSSWRNSFLDGNNNEPLPRSGRTFIAASSSLNDRKKPDSYKAVGVTKQTVFGVLCRLVGDQRKLYQSQQSDSYFLKGLEELVTFVDKPIFSNEITYIRNMAGSYDREAYTGPINTNHWLFKSDFSNGLWNLAFIDLNGLIDFIVNNVEHIGDVDLDPRKIIERFNSLKAITLNKVDQLGLTEDNVLEAIGTFNESRTNNKLKELFPSMQKSFSDIEYIKEDKVDIRAIYCSTLYLKLVRLNEQGVNIEGNIKGFSVAGLTPKDFMASFTQGKKKVYGNPYLKKEKIKGQGEVTSMMTKACGQLEISINVDRDKGQEIRSLIENAGVSPFYLGKKGLAYVSNIRV
ncbi:type I-Fv CRISPR-associated protein Cas5fv [Zhongshania sp. BJYM1]|uniref:type I-Fv CRISPR-associated protein Cas5fv n=1 Tax=Zhongshania aquatica TaxID=2965069 RepID=UPI0022B5DFB9|nr:type I-Fv CRISPR-associated protein Cas5fv [Marortus sp. BJYM1]